MLTIQHYTGTVWHSVGSPYPPGDAQRARQAATSLAHITGAIWRVVDGSGYVVSQWDGARWNDAAQSVPLPLPRSWWKQQDFDDTQPMHRA